MKKVTYPLGSLLANQFFAGRELFPHAGFAGLSYPGAGKPRSWRIRSSLDPKPAPALVGRVFQDISGHLPLDIAAQVHARLLHQRQQQAGDVGHLVGDGLQPRRGRQPPGPRPRCRSTGNAPSAHRPRRRGPWPGFSDCGTAPTRASHTKRATTSRSSATAVSRSVMCRHTPGALLLHVPPRICDGREGTIATSLAMSSQDWGNEPGPVSDPGLVSAKTQEPVTSTRAAARAIEHQSQVRQRNPGERRCPQRASPGDQSTASSTVPGPHGSSAATPRQPARRFSRAPSPASTRRRRPGDLARHRQTACHAWVRFLDLAGAEAPQRNLATVPT